MDVSLWAAIIGIVAGAIGYWFTTFSMQPILRFRDFRNQVLKDFIYYAQVINADGLNDEMQQLHRERILANRKTSAELAAAILDLPSWYLSCLKSKGQSPTEAAKHLIGYSNTTDYDQAHKVESLIKEAAWIATKNITNIKGSDSLIALPMYDILQAY